MYREKTVFVIGAGASWHYGYPTGEGLIQKMVEWGQAFGESEALAKLVGSIAQLAIRASSTRGDGWFWAAQGTLAPQALALANKLRESNPLVIDYFLSQHPQFQQVGRFLIAISLIECDYFGRHGRININRFDPIHRRFDQKEAVHDASTQFTATDDWYKNACLSRVA